jgi:hypothetical protein
MNNNVISLPAPRKDGACVDCHQAIAVSRDGRFCRKCLKQRINHENPISRVGRWYGYRTETFEGDDAA